ncbi:hypothetical protein ACFSAA_11050 [Sphingomonas qilianensis]
MSPFWLVVLVAGVALILQAVSSLDCDVSWLLTAAERVIDGATLYRDIEEVNPPASVLLYMPFVALARRLAMPVEPLTVVAITVLAAFSIAQAGRLLDPPAAARGWLAAVAAGVLLVLPADVFAQREHVALIASLPMLALLVARSEGRDVRTRDALSAGLGAGIMVVIKPHLVLALLPVLASAIARRGTFWRVLGVEWLAFAMVCTVYAVVVLCVFPHYLADMVPLLRLVYLPGRDSWAHLLLGTMVLIPAVAGALTVRLARNRVAPPAMVALLAAAGLVIAALVQGKGYLNHGYPAVALALLAVALQLVRPGPGRRFGALCGMILALIALFEYARVPEPYALRDAVVGIAPAHPRLIGVSTDFALGHPLTRWVQGRWVGRRGSLWVTGNARQQLRESGLTPARRAAFVRAEAEDAAMLAADIVRGRPDIVLVDDEPGTAWIGEHPRLVRAMAAYRPAARVGAIVLWVPRFAHQ